MSYQHLLLIDDDPDVVTLYTILVKKMELGHCFSAVHSGATGLRYLLETQRFPDVILVDIDMEDVDGFEFITRFEDEFYDSFPQTIVIILTNSMKDSDRKRAMEFRSVREFISKPIMSNRLRELIVGEYHAQ